MEEKTRQITPAKKASSPKAEALDLMVSYSRPVGLGWVMWGLWVCVEGRAESHGHSTSNADRSIDLPINQSVHPHPILKHHTQIHKHTVQRNHLQ